MTQVQLSITWQELRKRVEAKKRREQESNLFFQHANALMQGAFWAVSQLR